MRDNILKASALIMSISMLATIMVMSIPPTSAAPVTTLVISEPKYGTSPVYVNSLTEFTLTVSEIADIWYKWGTNNYTKYTAPFTAVVLLGGSGGAPGLPVELEGLQTLYYNATGEAQRSIQIYVDDYAPTTTISFTGPNFSGDFKYIDSSTQVSLSASDVGSGLKDIYYIINKEPEKLYTTPLKFPNLWLHDFFFYSLDELGNKEAMKSIALYVDNEAPNVEIVPGNPHSFKDDAIYILPTTPILLGITDSSGISSSSYKIDAGSWTQYMGDFTIYVEGQHTITAHATDNLGHSSADVMYLLHVDSTPPTVSAIGVLNNQIEVAYGERITLQSTDTGSDDCVIYYSFTGGSPWTVYSLPITIFNASNLTFYAADALGNSANHITIKVTIVPGSEKVDPEERESPSWMPYLGVALIVGGIILALSTLFMSRKSSPNIPSNKTERIRKSKREQDYEEKPKRKRRNR